MNYIYTKPDLTVFFALMPFIGVYMKADYDACETHAELVALMNNWLNESESTKNETRASNYTKGAYYLYALLTGKSYESK